MHEWCCYCLVVVVAVVAVVNVTHSGWIMAVAVVLTFVRAVVCCSCLEVNKCSWTRTNTKSPITFWNVLGNWSIEGAWLRCWTSTDGFGPMYNFWLLGFESWVVWLLNHSCHLFYCYNRLNTDMPYRATRCRRNGRKRERRETSKKHTRYWASRRRIVRTIFQEHLPM